MAQRKKTESARDCVQYVRGLERARDLVRSWSPDTAQEALAEIEDELNQARRQAGMPSEAEELRDQVAKLERELAEFRAESVPVRSDEEILREDGPDALLSVKAGKIQTLKSELLRLHEEVRELRAKHLPADAQESGRRRGRKPAPNGATPEPPAANTTEQAL
jgi:predicted  nucleic acid-binding Zn-ribbon protein